MSEWREVEGYEGLYEVSNKGQVRSLDRVDQRGRALTGRILAPSVQDYGYHKVYLYKEGKRETCLVHRLVVTAFLGLPNDLEVRHGLKKSHDNSVDNLRVGTHRNNMSEDLNRDHDFSSKHPGVCKIKQTGKWRASIHWEGKNKYLGCFENEDDAAICYRGYLIILTQCKKSRSSRPSQMS